MANLRAVAAADRERVFLGVGELAETISYTPWDADGVARALAAHVTRGRAFLDRQDDGEYQVEELEVRLGSAAAECPSPDYRDVWTIDGKSWQLAEVAGTSAPLGLHTLKLRRVTAIKKSGPGLAVRR